MQKTAKLVKVTVEWRSVVNMLSIAKYLLFWTLFHQANTLPTDTEYIENTTATDWDAVWKLLYMPIKDVPLLNVLLRAQHLHADAENAYIQWFFNYSPCPVTISSYTEQSKNSNRVKSNLYKNRHSFAIVTNMEYFNSTIRNFVQRAGIFFLIINDYEHSAEHMEILRAVLHRLWTRFNLFRNYLLTPKHGVIIYDPFEFDVARMSYGKIVVYDGIERLERTLFKDMRGYPLRVQIFKSVYARPIVDRETKKLVKVVGVDAKVAKLLADRMNFTMILQEPDPDYFGERDKNGTYNGAIGSTIKNKLDLCLTGFFVKDYMAPEIEFTVAVYDDQLCIYVPKAKRIPQSILPIFSVRYDLWLGFLLTPFACAAIWLLLRRTTYWLDIAANMSNVYVPTCIRKKWSLQFMRIFTDTWVMWVRVNVVNYPPFYAERIFIATLCLVSVIFGAIFESSLATVYIHPMYYKDITTLRELDDSGLNVVYKYSSMADDLFFSDTSPLFANLNKKLKHLKDLNYDLIYDISIKGGRASVTRYSSLMLESLHFLIAKTIWVVPECPKYYVISYVLPKDAPWEESVNDLLLRFLNAGLINKWIKETYTENDISIMKKYSFEAGNVFKVLTSADLQLAFFVVIGGNVLAALSFMCERFLKRKRIKVT